MFGEHRIITRTVTITTVETWTITIGAEVVTITPDPDRSADTPIAPIADRDDENYREDT